MYEVKVASSDEFLKSREVWNHLVFSMEYPSIFCMWEWIYCWWETLFSREDELVLLFLYKEDILKGILPLFTRRTALTRMGPTARILSYCGSTHLYPDHIDIISGRDDAEPCLDAVAAFLEDEKSNWDALELPCVTQNSSVMSWIKSSDKRLSHDLRPQSVAPYIPISVTFDEYMGSFTSKQRYNIRSRRNKLYTRHGARYVACNTATDTECLQTVFNLHEARALQKDVPSTFARPEVIRFHEYLLSQIADTERVWVRFLKAGNDVIASLYGFVLAGRLFFYQIGHEPTWGHLGPGTTILFEAIKEAFDRGFREFNFLQGSESYKYQWARNERKLFEVRIYSSSFRGKLPKLYFRTRESYRKSRQLLLEK